MTEWICPNGHEVSSDTGKLPHSCTQCDGDLSRVDIEISEEVREFAEEHNMNPKTVAERRRTE